MTCSVLAPTSSIDFLTQLKAASSAEEFFALLQVDFEPRILNVARLHILKRMGEYLAGEHLDDLPDGIAAARCKLVLARAYEDFETSSPLQQRVFKVLRSAAAPKRPVFVPYDELLK